MPKGSGFQCALTMNEPIRCFVCLGHGFQGHQVCFLCSGSGKLDAKSVCSCGRPATRKVKGVLICRALSCETRASNAGQEITTYNSDDYADMYTGMF